VLDRWEIFKRKKTFSFYFAVPYIDIIIFISQLTIFEDGINNHSIIKFAHEAVVYIENRLETIKQDMGLEDIKK
jgi:hypothetical protein